MTSVNLRALLRVAFPLMVTGATESMMMFSDRVFLSHYSVAAMNAASATATMCAVFIFVGMAVAGIAEVLAGQWNGEGRHELVGRPVWQLIYFSLATTVFYIPLGIWGADWLVPSSLVAEAKTYFLIISSVTPLFLIQAAIAGFFATTGRAAWLTPVAVVANLFNIVLDFILIFGWGPIPEMGAAGGAAGTAIAQFCHVVFLLWLFLRPREREKYGTGKLIWWPQEILQAIKVGVPNAVSHGVEVAAWAFLFRLVGETSESYMTVLSTAITAFIMLGFLTEGLRQGIVAIASNVVGTGRFEDCKILAQSGFKMQAGIAAAAAVPMLVFPELFISVMGEVARDESLHHDLILGLRCMWGFILFDGLVWVVSGVLTAGGDTKVAMVINTCCAWGLVILPNYLFLGSSWMSAWIVQAFTALYALVNFLLHFWRFRLGYWQRKLTAE